LKYATTSGLYLTDTSNFLFSDFGRPRRAGMGTMDFSCFGVSGCASGSLLAAAVMVLSSSTVGMTTAGRLGTFDIVLHLSTIGTAQTDDPSRFATLYKRHVVQDAGLWRERDHSQLAVLEPIINPHQRGFPIEL
jgi:hypothetical protein